MPSNCRSLRRFVSNSANTPSMSRKACPAAVPVSIGCSVALRMAPFAFTARTNILKITDAASQPVDPRDHQHVTGVKKILYRLKLGSAGCRRSAAPFSANDATPRRLERSFLNFETLITRAYTSIADDSHGLLRLSHLGLDHWTMAYQITVRQG